MRETREHSIDYIIWFEMNVEEKKKQNESKRSKDGGIRIQEKKESFSKAKKAVKRREREREREMQG